MDLQSTNPYSPPSADIAPRAPEGAEQIRRALLSHETSIKGIGNLYLFSAIFMLLFTFTTILVGLAELFSADLDDSGSAIGSLIVAGGFGAVGFLYLYSASGLRRLDPKVRIAATILSVLGLVGFPIGTLLNLYILYLLHSEKGKRVMTVDYQQVIEATPHIKYKTSVWLLVLLVLVVGLLAIGIVSVLVNL